MLQGIVVSDLDLVWMAARAQTLVGLLVIRRGGSAERLKHYVQTRVSLQRYSSAITRLIFHIECYRSGKTSCHFDKSVLGAVLLNSAVVRCVSN